MQATYTGKEKQRGETQNAPIICEKSTCNRPPMEEQKSDDRKKSQTRCPAGHVSSFEKKDICELAARTVDLIRAKANVTMAI